MRLCQSCHWWRDPGGRTVTAMTTFLLLLVLAAAGYLVATVRVLRHDRPTSAPQSHLDWAGPGLPSRPYTAR
jgi:hypothetical protein